MFRGRTSFIVPLLCCLLFLSQASIAYAYELLPLDRTLTQEEEILVLPGYVIDGEVYLSLAAICHHYDYLVQFDEATGTIFIDWDGSPGDKDFIIQLMAFTETTDRQAIQSPHALSVLNEQVDLAFILIDGYNFISFDDMAYLFGYDVYADNDTGTLTLTTDPLFGIAADALGAISKYAAERHIPLILNNPSAPLEGVAFENYNIYLVGENHAVAKNKDIMLYFIQYLNQHHDLRYIISESGYCETILVNKFLETGDTAIIDNIVSGALGSSAYTKDTYDFYMNLYNYNNTLPEDKKLIMVGLDVQHNALVGKSVLLDMLTSAETPDEEVPAAIEEAIEILSKDSVSIEEFELVADSAINNEVPFRDTLGDEGYTHFVFGLTAIAQSMEFYATRDFDLRENFIHENFRNIYRAFDIDICFGMFGGAHTMLDGMMGSSLNLAGYINTLPETKNKVLSIMVDYYNCYTMNSRTGEPIPIEPNFSAIFSKTIAGAIDGQLGLLSVDSDALGVTGLDTSFQYILSLKDSPASQPYGPME